MTVIDKAHFGGGAENIHFLKGREEPSPNQPPPALSPPPFSPTQVPMENAKTAVVYATFWIQKVTHPVSGHSFHQLQYAQMVVLDFPVFHVLNPAATQPPTPPLYVNIGWPHISVATLRKSFG